MRAQHTAAPRFPVTTARRREDGVAGAPGSQEEGLLSLPSESRLPPKGEREGGKYVCIFRSFIFCYYFSINIHVLEKLNVINLARPSFRVYVEVLTFFSVI